MEQRQHEQRQSIPPRPRPAASLENKKGATRSLKPDKKLERVLET